MKVTSHEADDKIFIYIDDLLHLVIKQDDFIGLQSYVKDILGTCEICRGSKVASLNDKIITCPKCHGVGPEPHMWCIEFNYFAGQQVAEYDSEEKWKAVLQELDMVLTGARESTPDIFDRISDGGMPGTDFKLSADDIAKIKWWQENVKGDVLKFIGALHLTEPAQAPSTEKGFTDAQMIDFANYVKHLGIKTTEECLADWKESGWDKGVEADEQRRQNYSGKGIMEVIDGRVVRTPYNEYQKRKSEEREKIEEQQHLFFDAAGLCQCYICQVRRHENLIEPKITYVEGPVISAEEAQAGLEFLTNPLQQVLAAGHQPANINCTCPKCKSEEAEANRIFGDQPGSIQTIHVPDGKGGWQDVQFYFVSPPPGELWGPAMGRIGYISPYVTGPGFEPAMQAAAQRMFDNQNKPEIQAGQIPVWKQGQSVDEWYAAKIEANRKDTLQKKYEIEKAARQSVAMEADKTILFFTSDGVPIRYADEFWVAGTDGPFMLKGLHSHKGASFIKITFASRESAQKHIDNNKTK